MKIGIVGLGYVGLPLAVAFAEAGHDVLCLDSDPAQGRGPERRTQLHRGHPDDATLAPVGERLHATTEPRRPAPHCDAIVICVPTPLTNSREPDLSYLLGAADAIAGDAAAGPAGRARVDHLPGHDPRAPGADPRGARACGSAATSTSPSRPSGSTPAAPTSRCAPRRSSSAASTPSRTERARALYAEICDEVVVVSTPETAELSKLLENIFRSVNIALVNELAQLCDRLGIDIWEVIDAASTKPFGFMRFEPGPGMGGHCLPVDPFYLAFKAREHDFYPEFIELAGKVNQAQPAFCVERIERALNDAGKPVNGSKVLILGAAYKAGVGDTRESPALKIMKLPAARSTPTSPTTTPTSPSCRTSACARSTWRRRWPRPTWSPSSPPTRRSTTTRWSRRRRS